jgi:hypothetical protein
MTYKYEKKYPLQCPFLRASGLKSGEAWQLKVRDVVWLDGGLCIHVREVRWREQIHIAEHIAPVVPGQEQAVLRLVEGRGPEERVFRDRALLVPSRRIMYTLRRRYARALYLSYDPGRKLPGPAKREITSPRDYDETAARKVAAALGRPEADPAELMRWYVL